MTLERAQSRDNSTNEIIANAGLVGQIRDAGKVLGLTEQEAIATLSRTYRKQKRADDATTKQDVLRNFLQSANTLREFAPDDTKYLDTDEVAAAFGQMQAQRQPHVHARQSLWAGGRGRAHRAAGGRQGAVCAAGAEGFRSAVHEAGAAGFR